MNGKGEKAVLETTNRWVIIWLCPLEAASSRKPSYTGCPLVPIRAMEGRTLELWGDSQIR